MKQSRAVGAPSRLHPGISLVSLSRSPLLDELRPLEFLIYLRLLGRSEEHRQVYCTNNELHRDARSTVKALRALEEKSLIKIKRVSTAIHRSGREIEVLR